jgi:hypothetical protein
MSNVLIISMACILSCLLVMPGCASVVAPEEYDYNVNCEDLGYGGYAFKLDSPPWEGTHSIDSIGSVTIEMINETHFNFTTSGILINAAIVKGGDGSNVYNYSGPAYGMPVSSDTILCTRVNPTNGLFYDISHIEFCYKITSQTTPPTPPPVPEFPPSITPLLGVVGLIGCAGVIILSLAKKQ